MTGLSANVQSALENLADVTVCEQELVEALEVATRLVASKAVHNPDLIDIMCRVSKTNRVTKMDIGNLERSIYGGM